MATSDDKRTAAIPVKRGDAPKAASKAGHRLERSGEQQTSESGAEPRSYSGPAVRRQPGHPTRGA